jgi:FixJ family two-component response regulator
MMDDRRIVAVVDDDESVRESLPDLLKSYGFDARPFASAEAFLQSGTMGTANCLILDVAMPGISGLELQRRLAKRNIDLPIIFITANSDDTLWAELRTSGAVASLLKPFSETAIVDALARALQQ